MDIAEEAADLVITRHQKRIESGKFTEEELDVRLNEHIGTMIDYLSVYPNSNSLLARFGKLVALPPI